MRRSQKPRVVFITGTDTGVGKTVLTALLLSHRRQSSDSALAIKPFCSGERGDAHLLYSLQNDDLTLEQINPFYFSEPLAPLVAARKHKRQIPIGDVLRHIRSVISHVPAIENQRSKIEDPVLLIEGAGGLLAPLGEPHISQFKVQSSKSKTQSSKCFTALDLINAIDCSVIVAAPNRLGTINHTLLTIRALKALKSVEIKVVLIDINHHSSLRNKQYAPRSNPSILTELLSPIPLFRIPYLTKNPSKTEEIHKFAKKIKKTLAQILA